MSIITLTTDYGLKDHYAASVKARILSINPGVTIVDISHLVPVMNIIHAAFLLQTVFRDFPKGTIHLVGVDSPAFDSKQFSDQYIAASLEDHFFVLENSGLLSLISEKTPLAVVNINSIRPIDTTFSGAEIVAPAAAKLASGVPLNELGLPASSLASFIPMRITKDDKRISGTIVHIDHFGNAITNISKEMVEDFVGDKDYYVRCGGHHFRNAIHSSIKQDGGNCFLFFNTQNLLEIGQFLGHAGEMLGVKTGDTVLVGLER